MQHESGKRILIDQALRKFINVNVTDDIIILTPKEKPKSSKVCWFLSAALVAYLLCYLIPFIGRAM